MQKEITLQKLFAPIEIAKELRVLGFNEPCFAVYAIEHQSTDESSTFYRFLTIDQLCKENNEFLATDDIRNSYSGDDVTAPLYQQVIDWFREKHNLHISIDNVNKPSSQMWGFDIQKLGGAIIDLWCQEKSVKDYYENFNNAIKSAIQIVKEDATNNNRK